VNRVCSVSSDQSSLLSASGFGGEEGEEAGATTSVTETAVAEVRARTGRAVVFLSPLMRVLIDFFQVGVGVNRGVLEDASREELTDSAVDPTAATSWTAESGAGRDSLASIVHAWTRGSTASI